MADLYQPRNAQELVERFLRDVRLAAVAEEIPEPPTQVGTDFWLTGNGIAGMCLLGFANIQTAEDNQNVLTATGDELERLRLGFGLPEVTATPASGSLTVTVLGATSIPDGQVFLYPNGVSGVVVGTYVNPADGDEVQVVATVTGTKGNLKSGSKVRFVNPPINVASEATVSQGSPLGGGTSEESDERKRARILNALQNRPAGGNWGQLRQAALDSLGSLSDAFVFPALGGPASIKIAPIKDFDLDNNDFSRAVSSTALDTVRGAIQSTLSAGIETVVQTVIDEPVDVTIKVTIPSAVAAGGNGDGWVDAEPWPSLVGDSMTGDMGRVTVQGITPTLDGLTLSAETSVAPLEGQTQIAWWSSKDRKFRTAMIIDVVDPTPGAWAITLDRPLVDSTGAGPAMDDYVCPAAQNLEAYGADWVDMFRALGPGENTSDDERLPRARRHPFVSVGAPSSITNAAFRYIVNRHAEITDYEFGYRSKTSPTVPSNTATAVNILTPRRFAVYPL